MAHLTSDRMLELRYDSAAMDAAETAHLAECSRCHAEWTVLAQLAAEMAVARRSTPSAAARQRYYALFDQVQTTSPLRSLVNQLTALLTFDSRRRPALQGVRSGAALAYRMVLAAGPQTSDAQAEPVEMELMVEPVQATRRITGDLLGLAELERTPALVELTRLEHGEHVEVESSADGRFVFTDVQPGRYQLTVTPLTGAVIVTEAVEIS
jgi:hypothetical protein